MFDRAAWLKEQRRKFPEKYREYNRKHKQKRRQQDKEYQRAYYARNAIRKRRMVMLAQIRKYGLTAEQYDAMVVESNGKCAICKQPQSLTRLGRPLPLHVDHDHATGKARGLLCQPCNLVIGFARDSPTRLLAVIEYLKDHGRP